MADAKNSSKPLVSVIVPVYGVASYVEACVESLLNQTFSDYELVLVDDGSPDRSGELLDRYSQCERVRVFHKENGGLSDARNFGVRVSRGEYVTFVDGDDRVSPYYIEALASQISQGESCLVVGLPITTGAEFEPSWRRPGRPRILTAQDFMHELLTKPVLVSAWAKLARRQLYEGAFFPKGMIYEDIATICRLVEGASFVALLDEPIYQYVMRPQSIVHAKSASVGELKDYSRALSAFEEDSHAIVSEDDPHYLYFLAIQYSRMYRLARKARGKEAETMRADALRFVRARKEVIVRDGTLPFIGRVRVLLLSVSPILHELACGAYELVREPISQLAQKVGAEKA